MGFLIYYLFLIDYRELYTNCMAEAYYIGHEFTNDYYLFD